MIGVVFQMHDRVLKREGNKLERGIFGTTCSPRLISIPLCIPSATKAIVSRLFQFVRDSDDVLPRIADKFSKLFAQHMTPPFSSVFNARKSTPHKHLEINNSCLGRD